MYRRTRVHSQHHNTCALKTPAWPRHLADSEETTLVLLPPRLGNVGKSRRPSSWLSALCVSSCPCFCSRSIYAIQPDDHEPTSPNFNSMRLACLFRVFSRLRGDSRPSLYERSFRKENAPLILNFPVGGLGSLGPFRASALYSVLEAFF